VEPLNISIEGLNLDTVIGGHYYGGDDDSGGSPKVLLDAIVEAATTRLVKDTEGRDIYGGLRKRVNEIRDDEIRTRVAAEVEAAFAEPFQPTNAYGEAKGESITIRSLIAKAVNEWFTKDTNNNYREGKRTAAGEFVKAAVDAALKKELAEAIADEKAKVVKAVQGKAAELLAQAVKDGLR